MKIDKEKLKISHFIVPIVLLVSVLNPYVEAQETLYQWAFMTAHYVLFIGGFLLIYRILRSSALWIIPSAIIIGFWHIPYFFALAAAYPLFRGLNDFFFILAGILAALGSSNLSLFSRFSLLILWMTADTILSIVFLLQNPAYSNVMYSFSPYSISQELTTAVAMWIDMSVIIIYVFGKFLRELLF
ncbi:DUF1404 domain-containing protein [Acidianus sulfidivorans JP7]|uniref:DUF1404 domain-containing protein n=1 Tax=Acidianus sulfidivorans JP7 TaxID=619593 RepID=A0A2U9IJW8_9CREN|nr:DUF1404 domain-containing protein [Acidianus sulfidivorans]AWR96310.1 DUF1404 domain-containing protein [Acidianus sulfidivorans JP7]